MIVLLLLHAPAARLVAAALATKARVIITSTALCFAAAIDRDRVDVAVVDPSVDSNEPGREAGANALVRSLGSAMSPPFVLYLSDSRSALSVRTALIRLGPAMVAARGIDDDPERIRAIIKGATASRLCEDVGRSLGDRLRGVRASLADALLDVIRCPLEFDSVPKLASAARMSSRAMSRALKDGGLAPAKDWLAAGRVLRVHWEFRDPTVRIRHVVEALGYSGEEPLAHDVKRVAGITPSELRRMATSLLVTVVAARLGHSRTNDQWDMQRIIRPTLAADMPNVRNEPAAAAVG